MRAIEHADDERGEPVVTGEQVSNASTAAMSAAPVVPAARSAISSATSVAEQHLITPPALSEFGVDPSAADDAPPPSLRFHEFIVALAMGSLLRVTPAITVGEQRKTATAPSDSPALSNAVQAVTIVLDCALEVWSFFDLNADGQVEKGEVWNLLETEKKRLTGARGYRGRRESAASSEGPPDAAILSRERWEEMAGRSGSVQFREFILAVTMWVEDEETSEPLVAPA